MRVACVNPTALLRGGASSDAIFTTAGAGLSAQPQAPWTSIGGAVTTPFVALPGLVSTRCVEQADASYLAVTIAANPADPRVDTISGDVTFGTTVLRDWGLHLIDLPVAMGDLVALTAVQAKAWAGRQRR